MIVLIHEKHHYQLPTERIFYNVPAELFRPRDWDGYFAGKYSKQEWANWYVHNGYDFTSAVTAIGRDEGVVKAGLKAGEYLICVYEQGSIYSVSVAVCADLSALGKAQNEAYAFKGPVKNTKSINAANREERRLWIISKLGLPAETTYQDANAALIASL